MKKLFLLFLCAFSIHSITAQSNAKKELGAWYMYNGSHKITDKFSLKSMAHFRFFEIGDDMQQFIARLGGNYKFTKNISATVGYAFLNTDTTFKMENGDFNEHRIYQDLNINHKIMDVNVAHRFRSEQRFFNSMTDNFIRYQLNLSYSINKKWSTHIYNEIFFDFNDDAYNQNWLGAGFNYKVSDILKIRAGYQTIHVDDVGNFHRILLGIAINTDHRKKN